MFESALGHRPFLTARWENLCLLNYAVPDELLLPHLPRGTELEHYQGSAYVSLVTFDFVETRVVGVSWPGFRNFPEVNLRFYVRQGDRRGVVFIREFVPQWLVARLARLIYNEPYETCSIRNQSRLTETHHERETEMRWRGQTHRVVVTAGAHSHRPGPDSVEHFFKEHKWGFGRDHAGRTIVYKVLHPVWDVWPVESHYIDVDFGQLYGEEWRFLTGKLPNSVVMARGSQVAVFPKVDLY